MNDTTVLNWQGMACSCLSSLIGPNKTQIEQVFYIFFHKMYVFWFARNNDKRLCFLQNYLIIIFKTCNICICSVRTKSVTQNQKFN